MSTILIGYRGTGKTTIGKRLADRLWQSFVDTDELIVKKAGKPIAAIFQEEGEKGFRDLEVQAVREALQLKDHVIALGGGAILREENRAAIRESGHRVIYLKCEVPELVKRIHADPQSAESRPNLTSLGGGSEEITKVLEEREPIYRQMMHGELDVTYLSPVDAVVYIVRLL